MATTDELTVAELDVLEVRQDPVTGRRVVKALAGGTMSLFEWRPDGTAVPLTPDGLSVQHFDVHGDHVWWFRSENSSESGRMVKQPLDGAVDSGVAVTSVPEGLLVGGFRTNGTVAVFGIATEVDTEMYVVDADLGSRHLSSLPGGVSMVTSLSPDGQTATIARVAAIEGMDFHRKQLHDVELADGAVAHTYPETLYNYWRSSQWGGRRVVYNDRTREGRVGLRIRDADRYGPGHLITDSAGGAPESGERFPDDRLPLDADLVAGDWLPEHPDADGRPVPPKRLLVTAYHSFRTALYVYDADTRRAIRVGIPDGLEVESQNDPGTSFQRPAALIESPDSLLVRLSGPTQKPGWARVDTRTGVVTTEGLPLAAPAEVPGAPRVEYGSTWVGEGAGRREVTYALFRPEGEVPEGGFPTVFAPHGGPWHHDKGTWNAAPMEYTQRGVAYVMYNYVGSTGLGLEQYDGLVRDGMMRKQVADGRAVRDHLIREGVADKAACAISGRSHGGTLTLTTLATQQGWTCGAAISPVVDFQAMGLDLGGVKVPFRNHVDRLKTIARSAQARLHARGRQPNWWPGLVLGTLNYFAAKKADLAWIPVNNAHLNKTDTLVIGAKFDRRSPDPYVKVYRDIVRRSGGRITYLQADGGHVTGATTVNPTKAAADFVIPRLHEAKANARKARTQPPNRARGQAVDRGPAAAPPTAHRGSRQQRRGSGTGPFRGKGKGLN